MSHNDQRPVKFSHHAERRLAERGISKADAEQIVRHGARRADVDDDFIAFGSISGEPLEVVCVEDGYDLVVKTVYDPAEHSF